MLGGVWCAASSTFALRKTVKDNHASYLVTDTVNRSFYADECLRSVETCKEAVAVIHETSDILSTGVFNLTKFVINDKELLKQQLPEEKRAKEVKDFGKESGKVLDIKWDLDEDSFYFTANESECTENGENLTRRVMLSKIAGIYDLQGLIGPITLQGKLILQEATRRQLEWDEPVTSHLAKEWDKWVLSIENISDLKIPRCFKPADFDDAYLELHHYFDASETTYGCCTYLRAVNRWGAIHTDLIVSKTKIAPLKTVSIPRLELQGAVLAAKIDSLLRRELDLQESWFWTDSEVVLKYLANKSDIYR